MVDYRADTFFVYNVSDGDYASLKAALLERVRDREAIVRVQAAVALAKLQNPEELDDVNFDADDAEDDDHPTKVLVEMMQHDPSA